MSTQAEEFRRIHSYLQAQGERYTFSELWTRPHQGAYHGHGCGRRRHAGAGRVQTRP